MCYMVVACIFASLILILSIVTVCMSISVCVCAPVYVYVCHHCGFSSGHTHWHTPTQAEYLFSFCSMSNLHLPIRNENKYSKKLQTNCHGLNKENHAFISLHEKKGCVAKCSNGNHVSIDTVNIQWYRDIMLAITSFEGNKSGFH